MADPERPLTSPDPAGQRSRGSGWGGCALWVAAFLIVTIGGCAIGLSLRSDPNAGQKPVTVEAGAGWTLQVHQDQSKAPCTELFGEPPSEGAEAPLLAGQCAFATEQEGGGSPSYKATSFTVDGQVIIFGPVPANVESVRLTLADGTHPQVRTGQRQGVHYFVRAASAKDVGPTILLDARGRAVTPPDAAPGG